MAPTSVQRFPTRRARCSATGAESMWSSPLPVEAVEDQIEPKLELLRVVIAGLHDVLGGQLGEVGELGRRELTEEDLDHRCRLLSRVERQAPLLQRETGDVAVQGGKRGGGH